MTDKPAESAVERWERQYGPGSYGRALNWMACSNVFNSIDAALAELQAENEALRRQVEALKCCGNCVNTDWLVGEPVCREKFKDGWYSGRVWPYDQCHHSPSRWEKRKP